MTSPQDSRTFFAENYTRLRSPHSPMEWMKRLFCDVVSGRYPKLVDLPTGAGKTELVVIWLLALAWYGQHRKDAVAVPRRLVWVVNRRVLVQQVFAIASDLVRRVNSDDAPELVEVRQALRQLSGSEKDIFHVVELRGQILADRDWAIRPTVAQLVIGTVDQIGSRLLFQGYGLGKWGRPQQAGLLGVDAWVAVDEAHLVPAFVLTVRQLRERCAPRAKTLPPPFDALFAQLPFWLTELSATPGLPRPSADEPFRLTEEEKNDPAITDRILASSTKRVEVRRLPKSDKPKEALVAALIDASKSSQCSRIAVFVGEVGIADKVAAGIRAELKKQGVTEEHICKITGRIRGYERDRLATQEAFQIFLSPRREDSSDGFGGRYFLIGTAAAEVGLDADADAIFCDFASLPTLLQRLGRLDRRGILSRRNANGKGDTPTMVIFAPSETKDAQASAKLPTLAAALKADTSPHSAELMAGAHWLTATKTKGEKAGDDAKEEKSAKDSTAPLIEAATWSVIGSSGSVCTPPQDWLAHENARIAAGPLVVPPMTDSVLDYWSATTEARSPNLSPHPFLYGLADEDEGTPLVGVAFRLEVEALRGTANDEDTEVPDASADVVEIFKRFPPLRTELHQMKLSAVREWLASDEGAKHPLVYRARDKWNAKPAGESASATAAALGPNSTLILPASMLMRDPCKNLLKDCEQPDGRDTAICDVLDGICDSKQARYLRAIEPPDGLAGENGAWRWDAEAEDQILPNAAKLEGFKQNLRKKLRIGGTEYTFRYYRPHRDNEQWQYLDDRPGQDGHLTRAQKEAAGLAEAIVPGGTWLASALSAAARHHDEGKRLPKWQRAFGRPSGKPELAKLAPGLDKPAPIYGYRHEWESLRRLVETGMIPSPEIPSETHALWCDLVLHLVGAHHGHLRPSITDNGLHPDFEASKQNPLRLEAAERFTRLQSRFGRWRLAYLEALLKTADAEGSRAIPEDEDDGN